MALRCAPLAWQGVVQPLRPPASPQPAPAPRPGRSRLAGPSALLAVPLARRVARRAEDVEVEMPELKLEASALAEPPDGAPFQAFYIFLGS